MKSFTLFIMKVIFEIALQLTKQKRQEHLTALLYL
jgi:hypothetical protein